MNKKSDIWFLVSASVLFGLFVLNIVGGNEVERNSEKLESMERRRPG